MRYMILIYGKESDWADVSPERIGEIMTAYQSYTEKLRSSGVLVSGDELDVVAKAKSVRGAGGSQVVDGPFVDTKEALGGYYLIDVANEAEALKWAKQCPAMLHNGGVEVRPVMVR
jgi:hypothetical protein